HYISVIVLSACWEVFPGKLGNDNQYVIFFCQIYPVIAIGIGITICAMHDKEDGHFRNVSLGSIVIHRNNFLRFRLRYDIIERTFSLFYFAGRSLRPYMFAKAVKTKE